MKNERLKRLIYAAMAAALCLSPAGCGKGAQTLSQTGTSGATEMKEEAFVDDLAENPEESFAEKSPMEAGSTESTFSGTGVEFPEFYEKEGDVISFQTEVIVSEEVRENGLRKLSAAAQKPDPVKALECLMGDVEITEKNEEENNYWYVGANGENLTVNNTSVGFSTRFFVYVSNAFRLQQGYSDYNADQYELDQDLEFATRQEAFEDIRQTFQTMGIDIGDRYKCYVLEHSMLESEEYAMDMNGNSNPADYKDAWTQEDDSYYFVINQQYGNTPAWHAFYDHSPLAADETAPVQVLYNRDGIQFLQLEKVFAFSEQEGIYDLKPFEEIAGALEAKYETLAEEGTYTVRQAVLYYMEKKMAEGQYEVIPVWIFQTVDNGSGKVLQDIVDAVGGEEIKITVED